MTTREPVHDMSMQKRQVCVMPPHTYERSVKISNLGLRATTVSHTRGGEGIYGSS